MYIESSSINVPTYSKLDNLAEWRIKRTSVLQQICSDTTTQFVRYNRYVIKCYINLRPHHLLVVKNFQNESNILTISSKPCVRDVRSRKKPHGRLIIEANEK